MTCMLSGPHLCTESTTPTGTFFSYISVQEVPKIASYKWDTGAAETYKVLMTNSLLASLWSGPALMEGMQTTMGLHPFPRTWICLLSVGDKWKHHDLAFPRSLLLFFLYSRRTKVPSNAACTTCEVAQHSGFTHASLYLHYLQFDLPAELLMGINFWVICTNSTIVTVFGPFKLVIWSRLF